MRSPKIRRGFTLVEFVVGIVLLAVALTGILGLSIRLPRRWIPVQQVRAAQLAQRIPRRDAGEVFRRAFRSQRRPFRCGETATEARPAYPACTDSASYGPDSGETRPTFNDVDDFDTSGPAGGRQLLYPGLDGGSAKRPIIGATR